MVRGLRASPSSALLTLGCKSMSLSRDTSRSDSFQPVRFGSLKLCS